MGDQPPTETGPSTTSRSRREAVQQRRHIDEGLEGRTRLALGVGGAVELAVFVIAPADHRLHGAVVLHGDDRGLRGVIGRRLDVDRLVDDRLGAALDAAVDRGLHLDHVSRR